MNGSAKTTESKQLRRNAVSASDKRKDNGIYEANLAEDYRKYDERRFGKARRS